MIILAACYSRPAERGEQVIRPLREFDEPLADLSRAIPFLELQQFLDADYPDGDLYYWKSVYLRQLSDEVIAVLARHAAKRPSTRSPIDVWGLGGAVSRVPASATPFARREAQFLIGIESNWNEPEGTEANIAWARETYAALQPFALGSYLNFTCLGEEGEQLLRGAYGGNFERLQAAKKRYDPQNLFRGTLSVRSSQAWATAGLSGSFGQSQRSCRSTGSPRQSARPTWPTSSERRERQWGSLSFRAQRGLRQSSG